MALLDLSLPSKTLVRLVDEAIQISPVKPAQAVNVTSLPPDKLLDVDNAIGIYLYHVVEEAAYRNTVWPRRPDHPRFSPLALNLHYIVSANSKLAEPFGPYREQMLMGMALKALHDYPSIDDCTEISNHKILDAGLMGDENRIKLSLRNIPATEAVSYWTAGSQPLRLSAYYEVSVILVEPDEPTAARGRVLTTGIESFIGGLPRLSATRNTVRFHIPTEAMPRQVSVQPAQVAIGDEMTLIGSALGGGTLELRVRGPGWVNARPVGPTWGVSGTADTIYATVQERIDVEAALPGAYTALIASTRTRTLPDGTTHKTVVTSNETPFQIVPQIATVGAVGPGGVFSVGGGLFADAKLPPGSVRASIGDVALVEKTSPLAPGQFEVMGPDRIDMALPATAVPGSFLPFRIIINGAESAPNWIEVP